MDDFASRKVEELGSKLAQQGKTITLLALDNRVLFLIAIADSVKPEAAETVQTLQNMGKEVVMLTGDSSATALAVAGEVGIPAACVIAGVLPSQKAEQIRSLQQQSLLQQRHPANDLESLHQPLLPDVSAASSK